MDFLEIIKAFFLGIVEGITEWLPISSTGHMLLVDQFMPLNMSDEFKNMFFVVIQLGAILAVITLFFKKLNPFAPSKSTFEKKETWSLWFKVFVACVPTVIVALPLDDIMEKYLSSPIVISCALVFYGVAFILIENYNKRRTPNVTELSKLTYKTALFIGLFQVLSIIPGTSRSGATIIGAILLGTSRYVAAEFTFFLAIPTMFGASALKIFKFGLDFSLTEAVILLVGMVTAYFVSVVVIRFLMSYIKKHDFKVFGWYRIALGIVVLLYFTLFKGA